MTPQVPAHIEHRGSVRGPDFHALVAAHDRVYGYDATNQRFMVSNDGRSWETRSEGKLLISIAVDPDDPDVVVATCEPGGAYRSDDGGQTFSRVGDTPAMLWLSWDEATGLWGAADDGVIFASQDGGRRWRSMGKVAGTPAALLAHDRDLFVGLTDGVIVRSRDGARSWKAVYTADSA